VNENFPSPHKSRLRLLSAEEIALWLSVTRNVTRRPGSHLPEPQQANPGTEAAATVVGSQADKEKAAKTSALPAGRQRPPRLVPLERRLRQKLSRGQLAPDAAIDLHGMRCQEAFMALRRFLARAQADGARLALVVTGKGERPGSGETAGILRQSVPHWLRSPEFQVIVAGFEEASRPHGGAGALYVKLRRRDRAMRGKPSL
jgi:DNA-nicking Smr family endonuclease